MGLQGKAAIAGYVELKPERKPQGEPLSGIQQWAMLAQMALRDAGIASSEVDGLVTSAVPETGMFAPATLAEYLGVELSFAEHVDLGGDGGDAQAHRQGDATPPDGCKSGPPGGLRRFSRRSSLDDGGLTALGYALVVRLLRRENRSQRGSRDLFNRLLGEI